MALRLKWVVALILSVSFISLNSNAEPEKRPIFKKEKIEIAGAKNKKTFEVEIAETMDQHSYGLMNLKSL